MEWTTIIVALIAGFPATVAAIAAAALSLQNGWKVDANTKITKEKASEVKQDVAAVSKTAGQVADAAATQAVVADIAAKEMKDALNGRLSELIRKAEDAGYAKGLANSQAFASTKQVDANTQAIAGHDSRLSRIEDLLQDISSQLKKLTGAA